MIVCRDRMVESLANEPNQKVSVYSFIVMKRHQVEVVETKNRPDQKDYDRSDAPRLFGNVLYTCGPQPQRVQCPYS